ncbi:MAG: PepSY-associated TM helix domain-containing protein [Nannocystaceae bacterium]
MPSSDSTPPASRRPRRRWRPWLRAAHRDVGYLLVGLTFVYALSGLAVNHIADWDPNFEAYERTVTLSTDARSLDDAALTAAALAAANIDDPAIDSFAIEDELQVTTDSAELTVTRSTGAVLVRGRSPRLLLRVSNWLHLNRGKRAWTFIADAYAILLLGLAISGMFMLPGRRGLRGRGAVLVAIGVSIPVLYVTLSGGP